MQVMQVAHGASSYTRNDFKYHGCFPLRGTTYALAVTILIVGTALATGAGYHFSAHKITLAVIAGSTTLVTLSLSLFGVNSMGSKMQKRRIAQLDTKRQDRLIHENNPKAQTIYQKYIDGIAPLEARNKEHKARSKLTPGQVADICAYIKKHKQAISANVLRTNVSFEAGSNVGLARTVFFAKKGPHEVGIYILFNKDPYVGAAHPDNKIDKKIWLAIDYETETLKACSRLSARLKDAVGRPFNVKVQREKAGYQMVSGVRDPENEIVKAEAQGDVINHHKQRKVRFITEYFASGDLSQVVDTKRLNVAQKKRIFMQIINIVDKFARHHLLHRDIKSGNFFVRADMTIAIGDHELMCREEDMEGRKLVCGTARNLSPELAYWGLARNSKTELECFGLERLIKEFVEARTVKSEVFAAACAAYEMFIGQLEWKDNRNSGQDSYSAELKALKRRYELGKHYKPEQISDPGTINNVLASAMHPDPQKRITIDNLMRIRGDLINYGLNSDKKLLGAIP